MIKLTKQNYVERDISWMHFNHRILEETQREDVPALERLSFLGIYSNNLGREDGTCSLPCLMTTKKRALLARQT